MDIVELLLVLPGLFSLVVLWWAQKTIADTVARRLFSAMVVLFFLPYLLHYPDKHIEEWLHHLPFYIGEVVYYFFLRRLIERYNIRPNRPRPIPMSLAAVIVPLETTRTLSGDWFSYITNEGLQHVLTIPLLLLLVSGIRVYLGFVSSLQLKQVINILLWASLPLMMIHLMEFLVESQHFFVALDGDPLEVLEYAWNMAALLVFVYGLGKLHLFTKQLESSTIPGLIA